MRKYTNLGNFAAYSVNNFKQNFVDYLIKYTLKEIYKVNLTAEDALMINNMGTMINISSELLDVIEKAVTNKSDSLYTFYYNVIVKLL